MGEIFANHATDKGLIYKIYKQLTQLNNTKKQQDQKTNTRANCMLVGYERRRKSGCPPVSGLGDSIRTGAQEEEVKLSSGQVVGKVPM